MPFDKSKFAENIKKIREELGLSQKTFSELFLVSKRTIAYIEAGDGRPTKKTLSKFLDLLFMFNESKLTEQSINLPKNFKEKLISHHSYLNEHYINLLLRKPKIPYAIRYKLIPSTFFDQPQETNKIKLFFSQHGWEYDTDTLSKALNRSRQTIDINTHPTKVNTYLYSRKTI